MPLPANEARESERRGDAALSSQRSRRSPRASRNSQTELAWIAGFFAAALVGGIASHQLLHGHAPISWPLTIVIALVVAAVPGAAAWTGVLDEPQPASKHSSSRSTGGQPVDPSSYGG